MMSNSEARKRATQTDDGLETVLAAHRFDSLNLRCKCGYRPRAIPVKDALSVRMARHRARHDAHVAAAIRDAGWRKA
jgi:hypothetical protein